MMSSIPRRIFDSLRRSRLGQIDFVTRLYREAVVRWHRSQDVQVGEFKIRFDPRDRYIPAKLIIEGGYETAEIAAFCALVSPGDVVLDIGANIGLYTLPISRAVGENGSVIAFEPDPDNLRILEHNVRVNGCENVKIVHCALGNQEGEIDLFQCDENRGFLSFADLGRTGRSIKVRLRRGAAVLDELNVGRPSIIKIDVEGAEPLVLEGLGFHPRLIQLEFVPHQLRALHFDPLEFLQSLNSEGYSIAAIDRHTGKLSYPSPEFLIQTADDTGAEFNLLLDRQPSAAVSDAAGI